MANYLPSARRYRPQKFHALLGQETLIQTLCNSLRTGQIPTAYLFFGPRGTGKTSVARLFAKALNCKAREGFEPCDNCPSCLEIASGCSMDVLEIDAASYRGIEEMRKISETAHYTTSSSPYRVYIIDEAHMLTKEAFNALLKTLEEPPPQVLFIMATTEPQKIPPTIASRCQRFALKRLSLPIIEKKLALILTDLGRDWEPAALHLIATQAYGGLRDAESLLDQLTAFTQGPLTYNAVVDALGIPSKEELFALTDALLNNKGAQALSWAASWLAKGKEPSLLILQLADHCRAALLSSMGATALIEEEAKTQERYQQLSALLSTYQWTTALEQCLITEQQLKYAPRPELLIDKLLLSLLRLRHQLPLEELVERLISLENSFTSPTKAPPVQTPLDERVQVEPVKTSPSTPSENSRYDTLLQFAAVELEGKILSRHQKIEP